MKRTKPEPPANSPRTDARWAVLAHLIRPQGRHGEILAEILTDFPERFSERKRLFLISPIAPAAPREISLEDHWPHKGRIVLKFAGIDSIEDADGVRGLDVAIPAEERAPLTDGAVYISDLIGCEVLDLARGGGERIGTVVDVDRAASLLVVADARRTEILIPFAKAYLEKVDLEARRIEMRLPAGLLEINDPLSEEERTALHARQPDDSGSRE